MPSALPRLPLYLALLLLTQCSRCKNDPAPADPASTLPPATQTGANTFGCLVNGQPYTPKGNVGQTNFAILYDATFHGGNLDIRTYRVDGNTQYVILGGDGINKAGVFPLSPQYHTGAIYFNDGLTSSCQTYDSGDSQTYCKGTLTVSKLDVQAGIVAGTFAFTLYQPGCDSLRVTQGRFDKHI